MSKKAEENSVICLNSESPIENVPSIAIAEHATNNHNVFSIRNLFSKLREIEHQIYQQNVFPKLVITDNSKAIIQAILNKLNRNSRRISEKDLWNNF